MNARNYFKRQYYPGPNARRVLAAVRRRFAARADFIVAGWLERCAADIEAAQWVFEDERKSGRRFGLGMSLVASAPRWDD